MVAPSGARGPASLLFARPLDAAWAERSRFVAHHRAAAAWLAARLRGPDEARGRSTRLRALRAALGELEALVVTRSSNTGSLAGAAAGSYEPEVDGPGPARVVVHLAAEGSAGAADVAVRVVFPVGEHGPPEVTLGAVHPRPRMPTRPPPTDEERAIVTLSAAICAAPGDDGPRLQLADLWSAQGEPRGEFVRAQIAGDEARAQALLVRHGTEWTDGLPVATAGRVHRRGFLCAARLECAPADLHPVIDSPAWNLLTSLDLRLDADVERELLTRAPLGGLLRLGGVHGETVESTPLPPRVNHLHVRGSFLECPAQLEALEVDARSFSELLVLSRQRRLSQLALLRVAAGANPRRDSLLALDWLLAKRPGRLVLIGRPRAGDEDIEVWRLEVEGETWRFTGDERVHRQLRALASEDVARSGGAP